MIQFQKHRMGWIIWGIVFVFLLTYVGSYGILSRRGFELADQYNMEGFYFFWPEDTDQWRRAEWTARFFYCPLIYVDNWIGTGRWPGSEPLWQLSHAIGSQTPHRMCFQWRNHLTLTVSSETQHKTDENNDTRSR